MSHRDKSAHSNIRISIHLTEHTCVTKLTRFVTELAFKVMYQYKPSVWSGVRGCDVRLKSGKFVARQVFQFLARPHFPSSTPPLRPPALPTSSSLSLLLLLTKKFNVVFSPEELQGHGTHIKRRRVQYSTVLVESRNCAISMTWQTSTSSNAA